MNAPSPRARRALHRLTRYLPPEVRDTYAEEWATDLAEARHVPLKLLELALAVPRLAIEERSARLHLEPIAARAADRIAFTLARVALAALVALTVLADAIFAYMSAAHGAETAWLKLAAFNAIVLAYWTIAYRGAFRDCPWLRTTRLASLLKLVWVAAPLAVALAGALPEDLGRLWVLSVLAYVPWEAHWNVVRPYRRHGVLDVD